eukprot:g10196.t1 g10196   contig4:1409182-1410257(+)
MGNSSSSGGGSADRNSNADRSSGNTGSSSIGGGINNLSSRITGGGSNNNAHFRPSVHLPSSLVSLRGGTGSLGLSKTELDARCQPSGLYPSCEWEPKAIRRLVGDGKLAARLKGADSRITKTDRECPICFMYYSENNVTKCCRATICTECYLQIKPQKDKHTTCPFCNNPKMIILVQKGMDEGDIAKREEEEQRVIEATIRNRAAQMNVEVPASPSGDPTTSLNTNGDGASSTHSSFGSSLADYNRSRTFSNSESTVSAGSGDQGEHQPPQLALETTTTMPFYLWQ